MATQAAHAHVSHLGVKLESSGLFSQGLLPRFRSFANLRPTFPSTGPVGGGQRISIAAAQKKPEISLSDVDENHHYTLLMADPDLPSPADPKMRWWLHELRTDVPGSRLKDGRILTPYAPPSPPTGVHRYVYVLAQQEEPKLRASPPSGRGRFDLPAFLASHRLTPVGVEWFTCEAGH